MLGEMLTAPPVKPFPDSSAGGAREAVGDTGLGFRAAACAVGRAGGDKWLLLVLSFFPPLLLGLRSSCCYQWMKIYGFLRLVILGWTEA